MAENPVEKKAAENPGIPEISKGLARNPIGIFSLFIMLVESLAAGVLTVRTVNLRPYERGPLIWFIVLFPVLVLFVFNNLVMHHHWKLYGPREHRTVASLLGQLDQQQIDRKVNSKFDSESTKKAISATATSQGKSSQSDASQIIVAEQTILRNRRKYLQAELLTIRKLKELYGFTFDRQIGFGGDTSMAFDAVALSGDTFNAVEIKLLTLPILVSSDFLEILKRASLASRFVAENSGGMFFRLILVVIVDSVENLVEKFELDVRRLIQDSPFPIDFHIWSFGGLVQDFGIEDR